MLKRLREATFHSFRRLRETSSGIGTPVAEYSESGPFHCADCKFLKKRGKTKGLCVETHMKKDPQTKKAKNGLAIVNLQKGCCRFVQPPSDKS